MASEEYNLLLGFQKIGPEGIRSNGSNATALTAEADRRVSDLGDVD